jgi:uncharacterized protein YbjT (DUF2867 family)
MILITGATGTVGAEVVKQLVADAQPVRALVRDPQRAARALPGEVELFRGDLLDADSMAEALQGVERMFLLSPPSERMLELETSAIAAARAARVAHLVKLSVINADPAARSFFEREHGKAEEAVRASGLTFTFLRPNFFMQNALRLAGTIKSQGAIYQPAADAAASYIDTRDIAAVAAKGLTTRGHEGRIYTLTGPEALTQAQLAEILSRAVGKPIRYVDVPRDAGKQAMLDVGVPQWQAEAVSQLMDDLRAGRMARVTDDVREVTGRVPRTFEQFAHENRAAFIG